MGYFVLLFAALALSGCGDTNNTSTSLEALDTREIRMPNGESLRVEVMIKQVDLSRGLMFRDSLPAGRGMLFIHKETSPYEYWMYQVKIPLDIIFMDTQHRVLGISADTPPCKTRASDCQRYGGYPGTKYVLEVGGGAARKYGVSPGVMISF